MLGELGSFGEFDRLVSVTFSAGRGGERIVSGKTETPVHRLYKSSIDVHDLFPLISSWQLLCQPVSMDDSDVVTD